MAELKKLWQKLADLPIGTEHIKDVADAVLQQLGRLAVAPEEKFRVEFGLELTAKAAAVVASAAATPQLHVALTWNPLHPPKAKSTEE